MHMNYLFAASALDLVAHTFHVSNHTIPYLVVVVPVWGYGGMVVIPPYQEPSIMFS